MKTFLLFLTALLILPVVSLPHVDPAALREDEIGVLVTLQEDQEDEADKIDAALRGSKRNLGRSWSSKVRSI